MQMHQRAADFEALKRAKPIPEPQKYLHNSDQGTSVGLSTPQKRRSSGSQVCFMVLGFFWKHFTQYILDILELSVVPQSCSTLCLFSLSF